MAKGNTLKTLKLPMLQPVCEGLGLDVPQPPMRRRAPYMELLKDITQNCSCQQGTNPMIHKDSAEARLQGRRVSY